MSSKLIKSPLAALLIGCLGTAFSAQADNSRIAQAADLLLATNPASTAKERAAA